MVDRLQDIESPGTGSSPPAASSASALRSLPWLDRAAVLPALAVTVVALGVTGVRIGRRQLWQDEYSTWIAASMTRSQLRHLVSNLDFVLFPYYLFMHYWIRLVGDSPAALRIPSVIAMSVSAGLLVLIGRRLFNTTVGVVAAAAFVALPPVSRYAQEARPYGLVMCFVALATLLLLRALERGTWWRWFLYAAGMVAVAGAHLVALVVVTAHVAGAVALSRPVTALCAASWWRRAGARYGRFVLALLFIAVAVTPFTIRAHKEAAAIAWITLDGQLHALPSALFGSRVDWVVIGFAALGGILLLARPGRRRAVPLLAAWAILPPVLLYVTFPALHAFLFRYMLFILPAWTLLGAYGLVALVQLAPWPAVRAAILVVALAALGGLVLPGERAARQHLEPGMNADFYGVGRIIGAQVRPGDGIAFGGYYPDARRAMTYVGRDWPVHPRDVFQSRSYIQKGSLFADECRVPASCLGDTTRIWLVTTAPGEYQYAQMTAAKADLLLRDFTVSENHSLYRVRVLLLVRSPTG